MRLLFRPILLFILLLALFCGQAAGQNQAGNETRLAPQLTPEELTWLKHHDRIRVGFWINAEPVLFKDKSGQPAGVTADYLDLANQALGGRLKVVFYANFVEARRGFLAGECDLLAAITPSRAHLKHFLITKPYLDMPVVLMTREKAPAIRGLVDLAGKRVVVNKGHVTEQWLAHDFPKIIPVPTESYEKGLNQVSAGKADALMAAMLPLIHFSRKGRINNLKIAAPTKYAYHLGFGVRTDWPVLAGILDKVVASVDEPARNAIYGKWVAMRFEYGVDWVSVWLWSGAGLAVALLLLGMVLLWNRRLMAEVALRQAAEALAMGSQERLRKTFEAQMDGIMVLDDQTPPRIVDVNTAACTIFGRKRGEMLGRTTRELHVSPESQARIRHALDLPGAAQRGYAHVGDIKLKRKNGMTFDAELSVAPLLDDHGELDGWVSVVRDVSREKAAQEERRRLFDISVDMFCVAGADGYFKDLNQAWTRTLGFTAEELKARPFMDFVHPEDLDATREAVSVLNEGERIVGFENRYLCKDGGWRWLAWNSVALEQGDVVYAVARDVTTNKELEEKLIRLATTDELTGLLNRRSFLERAQAEFERARRYGSPFTVLMLDLDHFKQVNDTHGHAAGDQTLREMAKACGSALRTNDLFGRLGGEEFAILLVESGPEQGRHTAERLRAAVGEMVIQDGGQRFQVTVSLGCTQMGQSDGSFQDVLRRADQALYQAKQSGRNQVALL